MTDSTNMYMPVAPAYGGGNGGFGFGDGNGAWWLLILLIAMGGWGNNGWNNGGAGGMFPWLMNGQTQGYSDVQRGFDQSAVINGITGVHNAVTSGFGDVQTALCSGFGNVQSALCGGFAGVNAGIAGAQNALAQQLYTNQIADMERSFAAQTANAQGLNAIQAQLGQNGMNTQMGFADAKYTLASEACATRATSTQNTQGILNAINGGIQSIKDQLCQDKIDAKNDEIATLRQQLAMKDLAASQTAQNGLIAQGFANEVDQLYNRLNTCPVPTTPVYGRTPIFTCGGNPTVGCGCGGFAA